MSRFRILPPAVPEARCVRCRAMTPTADLSRYGARCAQCFADYCDAAPAELNRGARPSVDRPEREWSHLPLATRQFLCTEALGMAGLQVYERAWREIPPRDRLRIVSAGSRMVAGLV